MYTDHNLKIYYNDYQLRVGDQYITQPSLSQLIVLYNQWDLFSADKLDKHFDTLLFVNQDVCWVEKWLEKWGFRDPKSMDFDQWVALVANGLLFKWAMSESIETFTKATDEDRMLEKLAPYITLFDQAKNLSMSLLEDIDLCNKLSYNEIIRLSNQRSFIKLASNPDIRKEMLYADWEAKTERLSEEEVISLLKNNPNLNS